MDKILAKLNLLLFALEKKLERLEQIKAYTLLQAPDAGASGLTPAMILAQKQEWIDDIKKLDQGFGSLSAELIPLLQKNPEPYSESIRQMQEMIGQMITAEREIRQAEKRNYAEHRINAGKKESKEDRPLPQAVGLKRYQQAKKGFSSEKKE